MSMLGYEESHTCVLDSLANARLAEREGFEPSIRY